MLGVKRGRDDLKHAKRKKRISIISALNQGKLKAPFIFEGTCNGCVFKKYIQHVLLPELKPGQVVVMDIS